MMLKSYKRTIHRIQDPLNHNKGQVRVVQSILKRERKAKRNLLKNVELSTSSAELRGQASDLNRNKQDKTPMVHMELGSDNCLAQAGSLESTRNNLPGQENKNDTMHSV